jgi:hypothetical protein
MTWDLANGRVGIGTTSPADILSVENDQNNYTESSFTNATNGAASQVSLKLQSDVGTFFIGQTATSYSAGGPCCGAAYIWENSFYDLVLGSGGGERMRLTAAGSIGIGTATPAALLDVAGAAKLGSAGTAMTAMGVCTVASYTPTNAVANKTCTGVPASSSIAVHCSPSAAFTTPITTVIIARATGTVNQLAVSLTVANAVAVSLTCMWVQP